MKEFNQILLDLKRKIYKPVYFLSGEEPYYIDLISDFIENNVLEADEREFNQTIVYGKDTGITEILGLAKQFPMMSEYQVVIVKEAQHIKELAKKSSEESESPLEETVAPSNSGNSQQLLNYLVKPQPSTILVFCYKYKTIDKRGAIGKALQKNAVLVETKKLYDNQLPEWITNYVKEKNYSIGPKAAFLIAESLGSELSKIINEIDKVLINLKPGGEVTPELVHSQIGISKEFNVFELQKAFSNKDVLKANRIINHFAANEKENPAPLVLSMLYAYFSKILRFHFLADKSKFAAASAMGVNPFFIEDYSRAASAFSIPKLKLIISHLKECDLKSKGIDNTSMPYGELLKELVFKILH